MTKKRWVAFDVETERLHYEVRGGWENPAGFGYTVGSAVDNEGNERVFSTHDYKSDARLALIDYLLQYDRIVSFNGLKFDNIVIAAGDDLILGALNEKSWDIKALLDHELGIDDKYGPHIISLQGVASATVNEQKALSDGREAVRLWRKGDYESVVKYNLQDARMTARVYEFGERNGYVLFEPARVPIVMGVGLDQADVADSFALNAKGLIVVKVRATWSANSS